MALFGSAVLFGQERGNIEALRALQQEGAQVLCLIRDDLKTAEITAALEAHEIQWRNVAYMNHFVPSRLAGQLLSNALRFAKANIQFLKTVIAFRPTHIHAFNQFYVLNFIVPLMLIRVPMVFRAGDEATTHNFAWRCLWRFVVWRTRHFVANSNFIAEALQRSGVPACRITIIYNSPPSRAMPNKPQARLGLPEGRLFGYLGQLGPHKGPHILVEAFQDLASSYQDTHVVIAGTVAHECGKSWAMALRRRVEEDPVLQSRVHFLGPIEDVPNFLSRIELLVVPSLFDDPSPNVVMEAKQAKRPAIVFPRGGLPELVSHGEDGFVCNEASSYALRRAMALYAANPTLAERQGARAYASLVRLRVPSFGQMWGDVYRIRSPKSNAPPKG